MIQKKALLAVLILSLAALVQCSGGGGGSPTPCAAPTQLATGAWCITTTNTSGTCGSGVSAPYGATFTQTGSDLTATSQFGASFSGTMCGNTATLTGNNSGFSTTVNLTFSSTSHASGTSNYQGSCSGTDMFTAASGTCP